MAERDYLWTDAGKIGATRSGVTEREVIDALYSPLRLEHEVGDLLLAVAGLAGTGRVIVVLCEHVDSGKVSGFGIIAARLATSQEIQLWKEGTSER